MFLLQISASSICDGLGPWQKHQGRMATGGQLLQSCHMGTELETPQRQGQGPEWLPSSPHDRLTHRSVVCYPPRCPSRQASGELSSAATVSQHLRKLISALK